MVVSMVLWSKTSFAWDGPSARSSLAGLFLGDISWVLCQAHKHGARQGWDLLAEGYKS
jgi:hypothetical protein